MDLTFYTIAAGVVMVLALIGTLIVAKNPEDKNYKSSTSSFKNLGVIYSLFIIGTLVAFAIFLYKQLK